MPKPTLPGGNGLRADRGPRDAGREAPEAVPGAEQAEPEAASLDHRLYWQEFDFSQNEQFDRMMRALHDERFRDEEDKVRERLNRLVERDLPGVITRTGMESWVTTSSLPHEIRVHHRKGQWYARVSAGLLVDAPKTKALLDAINDTNAQRSVSRRIWYNRKVVATAEMPLESLRRGDIERLIDEVLCTARLDAGYLSPFGGHSTVELAAVPAADLEREVNSWPEVLEASGTATAGEFEVWLDELTGEQCFIDPEPFPGEAPAVGVLFGPTFNESWPITVSDIVADVRASERDKRGADLARAVAQREGFAVEITTPARRPDDDDIEPADAEPGDYPYFRSSPGHWSAAEWAHKRFRALYPALEVKVLGPNNKKVRSDITLSSLRRRWKDSGLDPEDESWWY